MPEVIIATERRPGRLGVPRYELSTEDGQLLGYANLRDDIERNALAISNPGDTLRIEMVNGSVEEIEL